MKSYRVEVAFEGTKGRAYSFNVAPNVKMELGHSYHIVAMDTAHQEIPANNYRNATIKVIGIFLWSIAGIKTIFQAVEVGQSGEEKSESPIRRAWFNDAKQTTVVEFRDGDKIKVHVMDGMTYHRADGIAWALLKKVCGNSSKMRKLLQQLGALEEDEPHDTRNDKIELEME